MDDVINSVDSSKSLPLVKNGKCQGCFETTRDADVLHCYLCKNYYHVMNCTVTESLGSDALPSNTNLTNFSKFSSKSYPTGTFIWTCFRCGCIQQLASKDNISQRLAVLESILITMHPTLSSLANLMKNDVSQDINKLVTGIRDATTEHATGIPIDAPVATPVQVDSSSSGNNINKDSPHQFDVFCASTPPVAPSCHNSMPADITDQSTHHLAPKIVGSKLRIRVKSKSKNENGPPLRRILQHAHSAGKIGSYSARFHGSHKADLLFDNIDDAKSAHLSISSELEDVEASSPSCMNTKMIHVVGLTEDDSKESVYNAICKPGRNSAIEHLVNPYTLRVLDVQPCNKNPHVHRATVAISEDIWNMVLNKMNKKLNVDYLSCRVSSL